MLKKKGAGDELSAKKKAKPVSSAGELGFSQAEFKAWYHWDQENDPKNPAALKVEKALKAKMGAKAYRKFFNDMSDSYSARGHLKAYKECSACGDKTKSKVAEPKSSKELRAELSAAQDREAKTASKKARAESKSAKDSAGVSHKEVVAFMKGLGKRKWSWSREENAFVTSRDAQGRPMRGISKMSMESAIKKMQKAQEKAASDRRNREFMEQNFRRHPRFPKKTSKNTSETSYRETLEKEYASKADEKKVIAYMQSTHKCKYNRKTGKFDFPAVNFGGGHRKGAHSSSMESARESYGRKLVHLNENKDNKYVKYHIRDAKRAGWYENIPKTKLRKLEDAPKK